MSDEGPGPQGSTIQRMAGGRRKRGFNPVPLLAAVFVVGALAVLAWLKLGHHILPAAAMPAGNPSVAEAQACLRERDLACAEADYIAYLKKYPNDSRANATLAIVLTQDGRHRESLPYYRKAFDGGEATYDLYANYAVSLENTGDLDGAIAANRSALKIVPQLVDVRGALANELVRKGRPQEAIDLLESFDRTLEDRGEPAYFAEQIARIKAGQAGGAAGAVKEAADQLAPHDEAKAGTTLVQLKPGPGVLYVPVMLDGVVEADFVVDSGATHVVLTADVAQQLMRQDKLTRGDYQGEAYAVLADGSRVSARMYNLRSLKVGDRELHNVTAAVSPGRGQLLLGQSFLRRFKSWSIDNRKRVLVLTD